MPFQHSLFGCMSDTTQCLDTILCWPCQVGRQCNAVEGKSNNHGCCMCLGALCFCPLMTCCLRCKVSDKYQLGEGCIMSTCIGFFCGPCSLCQTGRELNYRGVNPGGFCCSSADQNGHR